MASLIALAGVSVVAGSYTAGPLDLQVADGEYLVLLGPSGAGKSLVLEAVAGLRDLRTGRVEIGGRDVSGLSPERRRVGLVPQEGLLFPHLDVAANIGYAVPRRRRKAAAAAAAERVGAADLLSRSVATLSGGERQRVALARALAREPEALLVDEPLGALDGPARAGLRDVLRSVCAAGLPVLHVTHDLAEASDLGDRWGVMLRGRLRQVGRPEEIVGHPCDEEVAAVVAGA